MHLGEMLEKSVKKYADRVALIYNEKKITYRELNASVNAVSNHLQRLGIKKGDQVALMLPNCPEFVISYFAVHKTGAAAVTLNVQSTAYELKYLLSNSDSKVFITSGVTAHRYEEIRNDIPLCRHMLVTDEAGGAFQKAISKGPFEFAMPDIHDDDPAVMIYTAGLTGKPLGAVLTHRNLTTTQATLVKDLYGGTEEYVALAAIPLFHSFGTAVNLLGPIYAGAATVLMDRFTLDGIFQTIEREKVQFIAAVPRLYLGMIFLEGAEKYDTSSLDFCITGGSKMPPEFMPIFEEKIGCILREGYGLTEASPVCSVIRPKKTPKLGSIGEAIPGVEMKIFDENEQEVPYGTIGEVVVRGENIMKGYYRNPEASAKVIRNGWLHTSDLGYMDEDHYIFLTGRTKRMIITSGFNVYPQEIENVLMMHPGVKSCRVVAKPDLIRGELVKAVLVKNPGAQLDERDIMKHCRTYLSSYKHPREVQFVDTIDALPSETM
jgi:long-chain acyl-CoA synthetase